MSGTKILMSYFADSSRPLNMAEMKELTIEERAELAALAAAEMGYTASKDANGNLIYVK